MKAVTARDAKNRFGELMDIAVVLSEVAYEKMKLEHLQAMLAVGEAQLDRGEWIEGKEFFEELRQGKYD